jgi:cysteinyl-tRNA synthetase
MNTALGITCIYDILKANTNDASKLEALKSIDYVLSVGLIDRAEKLNQKANETVATESANDNIDPELKAKIEELIAKRAEAKKAKNFAEADAIRGELSDMGVTIKDTREGTTYTLN